MAAVFEINNARRPVTRLRVARVRTGLNLRQFARDYGLSEARLCKVERGIEYIPPAWREVLAKALGVSVQDLIDERGFPKLDA